MADARAREQLRQEREAFDQAARHDKAWFMLRLAMGYLGLSFLPAMFAVTIWVLTHPASYGPLPTGAAIISLISQAIAMGYGIVRLVLQQSNVTRLEPLTGASPPARPDEAGDKNRRLRPPRHTAKRN